MAVTYRFRSKNDEQMKDLSAPRPGVWIDVVGMSEDDIYNLAQWHGLDDGHLRDAQDFFEAPRLEQEGKVVYFFTRFPARVDNEMTTAPVLIAVGEDFILTAVHESPEWLLRRLQKSDVFTTQKAKFFLQILSALEREYNKVFTAVRRDVRRSRLTLSKVTEQAIEASVQTEYTLNEFVAALVPTNTALQEVLKRKLLPLHEEDVDFVEDVQLANGQLIESAKSSLKTIQNIRSAHATIVSNRLNRVVRTLTALTIILTIPTIVGSFYGMNVTLPFGEHPAAFWWIVTGTGVLMGGVTYLFMRNRWF